MRKSFGTENALTLNPAMLLTGLFSLKMSRRFFLAAFFTLIFSFLLFHVLQINKTIYSSYLLEDLQKNVSKLSQENERLERGLAGTGSLADVESRASELGFERVSKIYYIQKTETSVASAK
jgi:hypothetical protein